MSKQRTTANRSTEPILARGQLSFVEHCLCPLHVNAVDSNDHTHKFEYFYTDGAKNRRKAQVRVRCPNGLSGTDEFFLWGLLGLTFRQAAPTFQFCATSHYCLKQLGCISSTSKGGKNYAQFRQSLERLASATYQNDAFYDPVRCEHREVSFGILSYSLPIDADSSRAWRIVWDPLFFEFTQATSGHLSFDLDLYRRLDAGSRRLFLLLKKIFWRRRKSPTFDVRHLATNVLGYSRDLDTKTLKAKVKRCTQILIQHDIIKIPNDAGIGSLFDKRAKGTYSICFHRGRYFDRPNRPSKPPGIIDSPLYDPLHAVGFDSRSIGRIVTSFKYRDIQMWTDVTLAALERKGRAFFRVSPEAFFMDNIQNAAQGRRTPPDWFLEIQKQENTTNSSSRRDGASDAQLTRAINVKSANNRTQHEQLVEEVFSRFRAVGQSEDKARHNAHRVARHSNVIIRK